MRSWEDQRINLLQETPKPIQVELYGAIFENISIKSSVFAWHPLSTIYYDGTISEFNMLSYPGMGENDFYSWFTGTFNGQTAIPYGTIDIICNDGTITMNKKNPESEDVE